MSVNGEYITAIELSEEWGISSRMIARHCKNGRISGAIKRGNLWLIPTDAQKPTGKSKVTSTILDIDENIAEEGVLAALNKIEATRPDGTFYPENLYKRLATYSRDNTIL